MAAVPLRVTVRSVAKLGREPSENEDFALADVTASRAAIADGASTSARPEVWARLLVESFVRDRQNPLAPDVLSRLRQAWHERVRTDGMPWYAQAKLLEGAHATFAGLRVDVKSCRYKVVAVGDSCLFHLRGQRLLLTGPIDDASRFGRFPDLVSSRPESRMPEPVLIEGGYEPGDLLVLATDALAKFLLTARERHPRWRSLNNLVRGPANFTRTIRGWRQRGLLDNDDTTVCVVRT